MGNQQTMIENKENAGQFSKIKANSSLIQKSSSLEIFTNEETYLKWKINVQIFKKKISLMDSQQNQIIQSAFLFPKSDKYVSHKSICGDTSGKAIFSYQCQYLTLEQSRQWHTLQNTPFTPSQLWNLIFTLSQYMHILQDSHVSIDTRAESIYVDLQTNIIKLFTPYSYFNFIPTYKHQKFNDSETEELKMRKLRVPKSMEQKNEDFNLGMIMCQCMLLEQCEHLYEVSLSNTKTLNHAYHAHLIDKIIKISYYPLKLKILVIGLIQLNQNDRFSINQIYELLSPYKQAIKAFSTFHLGRTIFLNIFKNKVAPIEDILKEFKDAANLKMYKSGIPVTNLCQNNYFAIPPKVLNYQQINNQISNNNSHSLNISIMNATKTNNFPDFQSLNFSKSQNRSISHQKDSIRQTKMHVNKSQTNFDNIKQSEKQISKNQKKDQYNISNDPFQQFARSDIQKSHSIKSSSKDNREKDMFSNHLNIEKAVSLEEQVKYPSANSLTIQQMDKQLLFQQRKSQILQNLKDKQPNPTEEIKSQQKQQKETKIQAKFLKQNDLSRIKSEHSSVAQYVSEIYEAPLPNEASSVSTHTLNSDSYNNFINTDKQSSQLRYLLNQNVFNETPLEQSYKSRSPFDKKGKFTHRNSIIDKLSPLMSQKKVSPPPVEFQQEDLSGAAQKKLEYWNTFKKFAPETIAQLNLPTSYPDNERLKRNMRQAMSFHELTINKTRQQFPDYKSKFSHSQYATKQNVQDLQKSL